MANVKFYLKEPKNSESLIFALFNFGFYEIDCEGKKNFKPFKYTTKERIKTKFWNSTKQRAKETIAFPEYSELNSYLDKLESNIKDIYRRLQNDKIIPTNDLLRIELEKIYNPEPDEKPMDLLSFIDNYINTVKFVYKNNKPVVISKLSIVKYKNVYSVLKEFASIHKKGKLAFDDINLEFYNEYLGFMQGTKKFADNTCGKHIATLKKFLNAATEEGKNFKTDFKNKKFAGISEATDKIYLTQTELLKIYNLDLTQNTRLEKVRDLFLLGCYTAIRYSDYSKINAESLYTNDKGTFLRINTHKTNTQVTIPLHKTAKEILNKYSNNPPNLISNQKMNKYLKEIGKLARINDPINITTTVGGEKKTLNSPKYELITTHTARRTGATNMYLSKIPVQSIMRITGHKTERAFIGYLKFTDEDNANILIESEFFKP